MVSIFAPFVPIVNASAKRKQDEVSLYLRLMFISIIRLYFEPRRTRRNVQSIENPLLPNMHQVHDSISSRISKCISTHSLDTNIGDTTGLPVEILMQAHIINQRMQNWTTDSTRDMHKRSMREISGPREEILDMPRNLASCQSCIRTRICHDSLSTNSFFLAASALHFLYST